jgi:hypothetical protein
MTASVQERKNTLDEVTIQALESVQAEFDKYIVFPSNEARDAVVLWTMHTHVFRSFESTPRLSIRSAEPGSGKSRVLEIIERLAPNTLSAVHLTPGVMWRCIENGSPTLLMDEADTIFGKQGSGSSHRELRAIINAGHRKGSTVPRCVGSEDVKQFRVFCPVALAGIGQLPETIATRSVEVVMRKRREGDPAVKPFRLKFAADDLARTFKLLEFWGVCAANALFTSMPDLPVSDRLADVWEPLVAIADLAGEQWGVRSRKACKRLTSDMSLSVGVQLLTDLHGVFDVEALTPVEMVERLYDVADGVWERGQFTSRAMARLLAEYGITATTVRIDGTPTRAYKRESFQTMWDTYVPEPVASFGDEGEVATEAHP